MAFANVRRVHATAQGWEVRRRLANAIGGNTRHARKELGILCDEGRHGLKLSKLSLSRLLVMPGTEAAAQHQQRRKKYYVGGMCYFFLFRL